MAPFDPRRHHRRSIRLRQYDYSRNGAYFVTICVQGRRRLFGSINNGRMVRNAFGEIADRAWRHLQVTNPQIYLDAWVVMPDHLHGILVVHNAGLRRKTVGRLIGSFKTVSTKHINRIRKTPGQRVWQRNYYERVIRNHTELDAIRAYIIANPSRWHEP